MVVSRRLLARVESLALAVVVLAGAGELVAWIVADVRSVELWWLLRDIKANAAVCLLLLAVSWLWPRAARVAAAVVAAVALVTIAEYALGVRWGFDQALAHDGSARHGRMRLAAACCLLALAVARGLLIRPGARSARASEIVGLLVVAVSGVATVGYVFEAAEIDAASSITFLPLLTAVGLLVLAHVCLFRVPEGFVSWLTTGRDSGALLLRRVLPIATVAVPTVTLLTVLGRRFGWLPAGVGAPISAVSIMGVITVALGYTARALRSADRARLQATEALTAVNYDLEERVHERAEQLRDEHSARDILLERDRIAADMHDHVIQRLYALGMELDAKAVRAGFNADSTLDGIDAAISDLRRTIHDLRTAPTAQGIDHQLRDLVAAAGEHFASPPSLTITGATGDIGSELGLHVMAVARETISNAVRHADARHLGVDLTVDDTGTTLTVRDDGRGIPDGIESTSGLRNIRDRAAQSGGVATIRPALPSGTTVTWFVPARDVDQPVSTVEHRLADAITAFAAHLGHGLHRDRMPTAAAHLRALVEADASSALDPRPDGMHVIWTEGFDAAGDPIDSLLPYAGSLSGHVATTRLPVRVRQLKQTPVATSAARAAEPFGPAMAIPVASNQRLHGVVVLLRANGAEPFTRADERSAGLFATCVATLLDQQPTTRSRGSALAGGVAGVGGPRGGVTVGRMPSTVDAT